MSDNPLSKRPGALIFDLDGTLVDTEPLYSIASQRVLDPFDKVYTAELKKRSMGGSSTKSAQLVIDEYNLPLTAEEYLETRQKHLIDLFANVDDIVGAGDFVSASRGQNSLMGVATSSHEALCNLKLKGKPWATDFDTIICGDHADLKRSKPAPDIFLLCARALEADPADCVAFEDSPNGIEAAKQAGMKVCALLSPYVDLADLDSADFVFSDYRELLPFVMNW